MQKILMQSGDFRFIAQLDESNPETCRWFLSKLPWDTQMIHVSWSGEASYVRLGDLAHSVPFEHAMRVPSRGDVLVYPGNIPNLQISGELFLCWGQSTFACENGNLTGNRLMYIVEGNDRLQEFGETVHLKGAQCVRFSLLP